MGVDFFNDDKNQVNFLKDVTLGNQDRSAMIDQLLQSLGSLNSQSLNRSQDTANAADLPLAARLAQERSISASSARAAKEGTQGIDEFINTTNLGGMQFLLQMAQRQREFNKSGEFDPNAGFAQIGKGLGGAAAGFLFGGPPGAAIGAGAATGSGG